jgi:hypothetical protein
MRATVDQLQSYKSRFPIPKFELPENIYTDDFDVTEAEKVKKMCPTLTLSHATRMPTHVYQLTWSQSRTLCLLHVRMFSHVHEYSSDRPEVYLDDDESSPFIIANLHNQDLRAIHTFTTCAIAINVVRNRNTNDSSKILNFCSPCCVLIWFNTPGCECAKVFLMYASTSSPQTRI